MAGFSSLLDSFLDVASVLDQLLWGPWTVLFIASVSIYLTVRTGFFQVRKLRLILKSTLGSIRGGAQAEREKMERGRMTPFQAASTALASTVRMGSIAGKTSHLMLRLEFVVTAAGDPKDFGPPLELLLVFFES